MNQLSTRDSNRLSTRLAFHGHRHLPWFVLKNNIVPSFVFLEFFLAEIKKAVHVGSHKDTGAFVEICYLVGAFCGKFSTRTEMVVKPEELIIF
jgi:hypothetical protein